MDVWGGELEWEDVYLPRIRTEPLRLSPDRDEVRKAIETLETAERPMLMAGTSVKWSRGAS